MAEKPEIEIRPEIEYGFVMAERILEHQGYRPLRFAKLIRILKKENPEDKNTRDKALYWLYVFKDYFIIGFDYDEKGVRVYKVDDEILLRTAKEEYWRRPKSISETKLLDLIRDKE